MAISVRCVGIDVVPFLECPQDPLMAALGSPGESGIWTHSLGVLGLTSLRPSSILTTPSRPSRAAKESDLWPHLSTISGLTSFSPSSILTTPFLAAHESGAWPNTVSTVSGLTSFHPQQYPYDPACPFCTSKESGVWPYLSAILGLMSFRATSILMAPSCPFHSVLMPVP